MKQNEFPFDALGDKNCSVSFHFERLAFSGKRYTAERSGKKRSTQHTSHQTEFRENPPGIFLRRMKKQTFHLSSCLFMYVILPYFLPVLFSLLYKQRTHALAVQRTRRHGILFRGNESGKAAAKHIFFGSRGRQSGRRLYIRKNYTHHNKFPSLFCLCVCV